MRRRFTSTEMDGAESDYSLRSILAFVEEHDTRAVGAFKGLKLSSAFQPVFSISHQRAVGHEALLRAENARGAPVSPLEVFGMAVATGEATQLDRLSRALHVSNHRAARSDDNWLFLNVNPAVVVHGKFHGAFFAELLRHHAFPPQRIVVEILEHAIHDEAVLAEAVEYYRELGCLVAIDDFGSGHSNFSRIWRLSPDIVKLDRSIIVHATRNRQARRMLPGLVSLTHEAGCLVLMEGIETEKEALAAMDADVDLVQGYYFGKPVAGIAEAPGTTGLLSDLHDRFMLMAMRDAGSQHANTAGHVDSFQRSVAALADGAAIEKACAGILAQAGVERCYLLDADGVQIGTNLVPPQGAAHADARFGPLEDASGANWFRRPYFRRAVAQPGVIQMSRPYLSITGVHMCITLSAAITIAGKTCILCCDVDWESVDKGAGDT